MKNFKLYGIGKRVQFGKDGIYLNSPNLNDLRVEDGGGILYPMMAATPTLPQHLATKEYVDNTNALVLSGTVVNSEGSVGAVSGELSIVTLDGLVLGGLNPASGELLRWDGSNWQPIPMNEGIRISTSVAINDNDIDFADGHVFVLESTGPVVWLDNGPAPALSKNSTGVVAIIDFNNFAGNFQTITIGEIGADSYIQDTHFRVTEAFDGDNIYMNVYHEQTVITGFAEFDGDIDMNGPATENVNLTANVAGFAGQSILLTGDGVKTLTTLVSEWNAGNVGNEVTLNSANGASVPVNLQAMQLSGNVSDERYLSETGTHHVATSADTYKSEDSDYVSEARTAKIFFQYTGAAPTVGQAYVHVQFTKV